MIFRSRAPLRLGLAGGGTDVAPYSDIYGGCVLNATISIYAHCTLEKTNNGKIVFDAQDINEYEECDSALYLELDGSVDLLKSICNRLVKDYIKKPLSFKLTTYSDVVMGSGLGGSSTMVVAIIHAFIECYQIPLGEYEIAKLAYKIEREDVGLSGGKQDQFSATFGGFNFMEFHGNNHTIVNPLRIKNRIINELEDSLLLYFTHTSRDSASIIESQITSSNNQSSDSLLAMHEIKSHALKMKEFLLLGNIKKFAQVMDSSWSSKKRTSGIVSNEILDKAYNTAKESGAIAGKINGAGGGGYMMFLMPPEKKMQVKRSLELLGGSTSNVKFDGEGSSGWRV